MTLEPLPLAANTSFEVPCRFIPCKRYPDLSTLGQALAEAPWQNLRFLVADRKG